MPNFKDPKISTFSRQISHPRETLQKGKKLIQLQIIIDSPNIQETINCKSYPKIPKFPTPITSSIFQIYNFERAMKIIIFIH